MNPKVIESRNRILKRKADKGSRSFDGQTSNFDDKRHAVLEGYHLRAYLKGQLFYGPALRGDNRMIINPKPNKVLQTIK